jgi:hypothetical protein
VDARYFAADRLQRETVARMLSLDQLPVVTTMTGADLLRLMEISAQRVDASGSPRPDALVFAGFACDITSTTAPVAVAGCRVNGRDLRPDDRYVVATNAFLVEGGDDYPPLAGVEWRPLEVGTDGRPELRDDVVLPRLETAGRPFVDLASRPVWSYGVTRMAFGVDGVRVDRSADYDDVSDSKAQAADSTTTRAELRLFALREQAEWRWENLLWARFGLLEPAGAAAREIDDDVRLDSSAVFTRYRLLGGASPYAGIIVDSELRPNRRVDGTTAPRQLETSLAAGLTWTGARWPRIRLGVAARGFPNDAGREDQSGVLAEVLYRLKPGPARPGLEGRLYLESLWSGSSAVQRGDLEVRLLVPVIHGLSLEPGLNLYAYDDSERDGMARYLRYVLELSYSWSARRQTW